MLGEIGQIAVPVRDVARATAFYRDVLGLRLLFEAPPGLAFFDCGGVRLMLSLPEGVSGETASSVLYFRVADIEAAHRELRSRGVAFRGEPHKVAELETHTLWLAFFGDGEGNMQALMSEVPRSG